MGEDDPDIYDPAFVADLFDRCSARYRWWSAVASVGFITAWRRTCVARLKGAQTVARVKGGMVPARPRVVDLMAGTGEVWPHVLQTYPKAMITAVDISGAMHREAVERLHGERAHQIEHVQADALTTELPEDADLVVSTFGLKTLTPAGQVILARRIARTLRPGGAFALIEASDPRGWILAPVYRFYMTRVLPAVERTFLQGAQDFAMIGVYTRNFGDCSQFAEALRAEGLFVTYRRHMFGCATSVAGFRRLDDD